MTHRNSDCTRCEIEGCARRSIRGYSIELCPHHRQIVVDDIMSTGLTKRSCFWPGCRADVGNSTLRICNSHMAVVLDHAMQRPAMKWNMIHLEKYWWDKKPPAPKKSVVDGHVYFLRIGGYVKIGWTSNLSKRMKGYPPDTQLLALMPGTRKDELALHKRFAHLKTHGREWFPLAPQITEYIDRVVADHGAPPAVDFSAKKTQRIVGPRLNTVVGGANKSFGVRHVS